MGRNKELRRKIAAQEKVIEDHVEKIRLEGMKARPNETYTAGWQIEIETARKKVLQLTRRLKRKW